MESKEVLISYMESKPLSQKEEQELFEWIANYIELDEPAQQAALGQVSYQEEGVTKIVTHDEVVWAYWDLILVYDSNPINTQPPLIDKHDRHIHKWGWIYIVLVGLMGAMTSFLDKCNL